MRMSSMGRMILTEREARKLKAYRCSVGVWTIGVGHTSAAGPPKVTPDLCITAAEADSIFIRDLRKFEDGVEAAVAGSPRPLRQYEIDALVSLAFNIGVPAFARSTVARLIREGDFDGAGDAILMWNKPAEILSRRRAEQAQFRGESPVARLDEPKAAPRPAMRPIVPTVTSPPPPSSAPRPAAFSSLLAWFQGQRA